MNGRNIIKTKKNRFLPYDRYGKVILGLEWIPLSKDNLYEKEIFLINFKPKSHSSLHKHYGIEEFFVLEGELIDEDGQIFQKGDFVRFETGTQHSSYTKKGCKLLVILSGGKNKLID